MSIQTGAEGWDGYVSAGISMDLHSRLELARERYSEMKVSDMFSGSFLKAADLQGKRVRVNIEWVGQEMLRDDKGGEQEKIVVQFRKRDKKLVLNKTNAETIARMLGDDTDDWIGKEIQLYPAQVNFAGQMVPEIGRAHV